MECSRDEDVIEQWRFLYAVPGDPAKFTGEPALIEWLGCSRRIRDRGGAHPLPRAITASGAAGDGQRPNSVFECVNGGAGKNEGIDAGSGVNGGDADGIAPGGLLSHPRPLAIGLSASRFRNLYGADFLRRFLEAFQACLKLRDGILHHVEMLIDKPQLSRSGNPLQDFPKAQLIIVVAAEQLQETCGITLQCSNFGLESSRIGHIVASVVWNYLSSRTGTQVCSALHTLSRINTMERDEFNMFEAINMTRVQRYYSMSS
jgi:hypothetical protein